MLQDNPLVRGKMPIYELGNPDPIAYVNASGTSAIERISVNNKNIKWGKREREYSSGMDFCVSIDGADVHDVVKFRTNGKRCELTMLGTPGSKNIRKILLDGIFSLCVESVDLTGETVEIAFCQVVVVDDYMWEIAVDDIVSETIIYLNVQMKP